jgi:hypothetical protein
MSGARPAFLLAFLAFLIPPPAAAQETSRQPTGPGLDLTIGGTGLAIGHIPRVNGIRLNFRDRYLEEVNA